MASTLIHTIVGKSLSTKNHLKFGGDTLRNMACLNIEVVQLSFTSHYTIFLLYDGCLYCLM